VFHTSAIFPVDAVTISGATYCRRKNEILQAAGRFLKRKSDGVKLPS
jgi:hypothetical protein